MNTWFTVGWITVLIAAVALEIAALVRDEGGDTASEQIWTVLSYHPIVWFVALGLVAWFVIHIFARTWVWP